MTENTNDKKAPAGKWSRPMGWIAALWLIGCLGMCGSQAAAWSHPLHGLASAVLPGLFLSPFQLIYLIPAGLIGWSIGSFRRLKPHRWWLSMVLPLILSFAPMVSRIADRLEPGRRFERFTKVGFPQHARSVEANFSGGFFADITDTYTFECTREEADQLIKSLGLKKSDNIKSHIHGFPGGDFSPARNGWQDPERWETRKAPGKTEFFELFTDGTHTRVHVIYGTI